MIPVMDVSRQFQSIEDEIISEVRRVLSSGSYIMGKDVEEFETEFAVYLGTKYAVSVANGTDALVIALKALGIGHGDEVITTAMSFFATAEAISRAGATPVFADCSRSFYTAKPEEIEKKITERTKAIIPVHLYGQCADMDAIRSLAKQYGLHVIEDAAQAVGAEFRGIKAGTMGDLGCFSFFPTKNLGAAGDSGIIVTNHLDLARKCRALRVHGSGLDGKYFYEQIHQTKTNISFENNLPKYYNYVIGYNSRMDTLQAAILRVKLHYLDQWNKKRQLLAHRYHEGIINKAVACPVCRPDCIHIYYVYVVCVDDSQRFRAYLHEKGISSGTYFPVPLHLQKVYEDLGYQPGDMPNAEYVAEHSVALPMFPELTKEEQDYVIEAVNEYK